jgi:methylmalonyl-CoA mutase N-terminal domain/subunit
MSEDDADDEGRRGDRSAYEEAKQAWAESTLQDTLDKHPERKDEFPSFSGREVQRLYGPGDVADVDPVDDVGFPGEYPYTRGVYPTMYRGRLWTMRQYAGFGTARETNERYHYLLESGQTGLSVAFDLPTQIGYDSDHAMAQGEVGRVGVAVDSVEDMHTLFDGIPLDEVTTSMTINAPAPVLLAMYLVVAEEQGVGFDEVGGTIQNDILKEYIARGTYIYPPEPSMRLVTDVFAFCSERVPRWNTISISGYHIREAGATAAQELAFTLGNARAYVDAALEAGLDVDDFAPRLSFFFNAHNDLLEEVAKFRAARRLWARIMREEYGAEDPDSWRLRFHTQTGGSTLTAQQPHNNVVRVAVQALAATLGGTQSLHTNALDEALGLPTEKTARIALRTQQILAHESGVGNTIDPLGGAYSIEALTEELEEDARDIMEGIQRRGGTLEAVETGWVQQRIQEAAYEHQQLVEEEERTVVGVNAFTQGGEEADTEVQQADPELEEAQVERLEELRASRDQDAVDDALADLQAAAEGTENTMPHILEAVRARATVGEICDALRDVWGEHEPADAVGR